MTEKRSHHSGKYGKFRLAILARDWPDLEEQIRKRCTIDIYDEDPCWLWLGAVTPAGYGISGRGDTRVFVHRLVAWSRDGFRGEIKRFPQVHHVCGIRNCVSPGHVRPVTALANLLEAGLRAYLTRLIDGLYEALELEAPGHALLLERQALSESTLKPRIVRGNSFENVDLRVLKMTNVADQAVSRLQNRNRRFAQVIAVDKLVRAGMSRRQARDEVGMSRSAYDDWSIKLRLKIAAS